jgi:CrcB protein
MTKLILVLLCGAIGTGCRFGMTNLLAVLFGLQTFPLATFTVNITGSFLIGFLAELFNQRFPVTPEIRAAVLVGFLGGYTTFSSFAYEILTLSRKEGGMLGIGYCLASIFLGLLAVWAGAKFGSSI